MGWISNDGHHEGYLALVLANGEATSTSNIKGPVVRIYDDAGNYTGDDEQRGDDEIVAWRLCCDCASPTPSGCASTWAGDTWQRVPTPVLENIDQGRIYVAAGEPASIVADRPDVADIVHARWQTKHLSPLDALATIRSAQENIAAEAERLDEAVAYARSAGQTWQAIGHAAGMSRQGAQERWG